VLSPCPLQGFGFEAILIFNSAMFNLVEALPVMSSSCQWVELTEVEKIQSGGRIFQFIIRERRSEEITTITQIIEENEVFGDRSDQER
jgi:hypothetical protein